MFDIASISDENLALGMRAVIKEIVAAPASSSSVSSPVQGHEVPLFDLLATNAVVKLAAATQVLGVGNVPTPAQVWLV